MPATSWFLATTVLLVLCAAALFVPFLLGAL
jgi:hypothetical protein